MNRIVLDTSVFVSAHVFGGKPGRLWRALVDQDARLVSSPAILAEVARVLSDKFGISTSRVEAVLLQAARVGELVRPVRTLLIVADEPDNRVLECAVEGGADAVVTGDRDLLDLGSYCGIDIVTVAHALERLGIKEDAR